MRLYLAAPEKPRRPRALQLPCRVISELDFFQYEEVPCCLPPETILAFSEALSLSLAQRIPLAVVQSPEARYLTWDAMLDKEC